MSNFVKNNLQELIEGMIHEVLGKFNFQMFKQIAATDQRPHSSKNPHHGTNPEHPEIAYAKKTLPELGAGSSRITFALSGGKALKIALNRAGIAQNEAELDVFTRNQNSNLVTRIFDYDPNLKWLVAEIVKPFRSDDEFSRLAGASYRVIIRAALSGRDPSEFINLELKNLAGDLEYYKSNPTHNQFNIDSVSQRIQNYKDLLKNQSALALASGIQQMITKNHLDEGDVHIEHFGRTVEGQIRFFDYGATEDVMNNYYLGGKSSDDGSYSGSEF